MKRPIRLLLSAAWIAASALAPVAATARSTPAPAASPGPQSLDPARQRALYLGIIESLRKEGSARAALAYLDSFDGQYPHDARAQVLRADCLADIGDTASAEALYRKAASGAFADQAQAGLGHIFAARADWTDAVAAFSEAVKRKPTQASYLNDLGFALLQSGRTDEGLFRLRQALELAPNDVLARNNLIVALKAAGRTQEADAVVETIKTPIERGAAKAVLAAAPVKMPAPLVKGEAR